MSMIELFNKNVSNAVNKNEDFYRVWFGREDFTPELIIIDSADFNCGAVANELEFARLVTDYYVQAFSLDEAEAGELQDLIEGFIDLPRRGAVESDSTYRKRFRFITVEQVNERRTTRWAILDSIRYFISDMSTVQLIEPFSAYNLYFQIRIEAAISTDGIIFCNNLTCAWVDQNFLGGPSLGEVVTYLSDLIRRIKAAGVDFDIIFVEQNRFTKTGFAVVGSVQLYKSCAAVVMAHISFTKTCDAEVV